MRYVLFVCNEHDGRSQMAQAFFERAAPGGVRAESAGARRPVRIQPLIVEAMLEVGVDIARHRPRRLLVEMQIHADMAVTIGCSDACQYVASSVEDWQLREPAGLDLDGVRALRDDIERRVRALVADGLHEMLTPTPHRLGLMQLLPVLVDEFQGVRSPEEIRSCADAILGLYNPGRERADVLTLVHKRAQDCLRADVCDPRAPIADRLPEPLSEPTAQQLALPQLLLLLGDEFRDSRSPEEIRSCAGAILGQYSAAPGRADVLALAHKRAQDCLRADVCDPLASA